MNTDPTFSLTISLPAWVSSAVDFEQTYASDLDRMQLAVFLARENVRYESGGPFGAAIFEAESGRLVSVGVNRVVNLNNSTLHAEMVAFMLAQARLQSYTLSNAHGPAHELFTSCEPCAMCLGATPWSGVQRVVWAATRDDAGRLAFDEGPVFQATYDYLTARGIRFAAGPMREEARRILIEYDRQGGEIYNG